MKFYLDEIETIENITTDVKYYKLTYKNNYDLVHIVETDKISEIKQELDLSLVVDESQIK